MIFQLLGIGLLAGLIAGVSPCVLPILPVVFANWATTTENNKRNTRRALMTVFGLVVSFTIVTLAASTALNALHLPDSLVRNLGIAMIIVLGVALLVPRLEELLERPFRRLGAAPPAGATSGFVLGLALGAVFVPCAGPVLATVTVLAARGHVSLSTFLLTLTFSIGAVIPMTAIALAGDRVIARNKKLRDGSRRLRPIAGVLLIVMGVGLAANWFAGVQRWLPGYTSALQRHVELSPTATKDLRSLSHPSSGGRRYVTCSLGASQLANCGAAPEFAGITSWFNTPGNRGLSISSLRHKVVLIDFWTYSCINCQRTIPHVEAWWQRYRTSGLEVIGVHSPEFAFEHDLSNVTSGARSLGVTYPVAVDNNLSTWTAYQNEYWPAEYLIDATGVIRHEDAGEGDYTLSETLIRQLLQQANPKLVLPPRTDVADLTPTNSSISPETYLGADRSTYLEGGSLTYGQFDHYSFPAALDGYSYAMSGSFEAWSDHVLAGNNAQIELRFTAHHVYLVLGGRGTLVVTVGSASTVVRVAGFPRLYDLFDSRNLTSDVMTLKFSPGVSAYDFTFG